MTFEAAEAQDVVGGEDKIIASVGRVDGGIAYVNELDDAFARERDERVGRTRP